MTERKPTTLAVIRPLFLSRESADSVRLTNYLACGKLYPYSSFPRHFDLALYSPAIQKLYASCKQVHIVGDDVRMVAFAELEKFKKRYPLVSTITTDVEAEFNAKMTEKAAGERLLIVYVDLGDGLTKVTNVIFGEYTSVKSVRYELINTNNKPLLEMHTHPDNTFFSPQDYYPMIVNLSDELPLVKGILVLCPDFQLMALATEQTPLIPHEDASRLVETWGSKVLRGDDEKSKELASKADQLMERRGRFNEKDARAINEKYQDIMRQRGLARKERRRLVREIKRSQANFNRRNAEFEQELKKVQDELSMHDSATLIEFARLINVKLYISTNMKDFYEFTA